MSVSLLSRYTLCAGARKYSCAAPSDATTPSPFQNRQRLWRPFRQKSHSPHVLLGLTATLSPIAKSQTPLLTPAPISMIVPVASWPGTSGKTVPSNSPSKTWVSVPHIPTAAVLIRISLNPGIGMSRSSIARRFSAVNTTARITAPFSYPLADTIIFHCYISDIYTVVISAPYWQDACVPAQGRAQCHVTPKPMQCDERGVMAPNSWLSPSVTPDCTFSCGQFPHPIPWQQALPQAPRKGKYERRELVLRDKAGALRCHTRPPYERPRYPDLPDDVFRL